VKKVLVLGGASFDSIIRLNELPGDKPNTIFAKKYFDAVGGTGSGKALNLNRLGFDVRLVAKIGNDQAGEKIKKLFQDENLNYYPVIDPVSTELHTNLIDDNGDRISIYTNPATFDIKFDNDVIREHLGWCDIVVLNINSYTRHWIDAIKESKKEVWVDIHDYDGVEEYHKDFIQASDLLFLSSDKMKDYMDFSLKQLKINKFVVVTHGKEGSTYIDMESVNHQPIMKNLPFVDSNGAGDSFFSGFMYGYFKYGSVHDAMKYGTILGGLTIQSEKLYHENLSIETLEQLKKTFNG
jgi:sugar/nucleoside kinase (ribokinase family)